MKPKRTDARSTLLVAIGVTVLVAASITLAEVFLAIERAGLAAGADATMGSIVPMLVFQASLPGLLMCVLGGYLGARLARRLGYGASPTTRGRRFVQAALFAVVGLAVVIAVSYLLAFFASLALQPVLPYIVPVGSTVDWLPAIPVMLAPPAVIAIIAAALATFVGNRRVAAE